MTTGYTAAPNCWLSAPRSRATLAMERGARPGVDRPGSGAAQASGLMAIRPAALVERQSGSCRVVDPLREAIFIAEIEHE